jgi:hypothetical protein
MTSIKGNNSRTRRNLMERTKNIESHKNCVDSKKGTSHGIKKKTKSK